MAGREALAAIYSEDNELAHSDANRFELGTRVVLLIWGFPQVNLLAIQNGGRDADIFFIYESMGGRSCCMRHDTLRAGCRLLFLQVR